MEPYILEFTIPELPPIANTTLYKHWAVKLKIARRWKDLVALSVYHSKPIQPLKRAHLILTRFSSKEPDQDGLISGFKHTIDALVINDIIEDDKPSNLGQVEYRWRKAPKGKGYITVRVEGEV